MDGVIITKLRRDDETGRYRARVNGVDVETISAPFGCWCVKTATGWRELLPPVQRELNRKVKKLEKLERKEKVDGSESNVVAA